MMKEITLPAIAENVETATVINVVVSEGEMIEKDQPIVEMESDKAAFDVPSPVRGTVQTIRINAGDKVKVGDVLATVETEGEERQTESEKEAGQAEQDKVSVAEESKEIAVEKASREKSRTEPLKAQTPAKTEEARRPQEVPAAPSVRRLARELGVDIYQVSGAGPAGRISAEDVKAFAKQIVSDKQPGAAQAVSETLPDFAQWGVVRREPLSHLRQVIAENMVQSWQTIPQVTQFDRADVTALEEFRKRYGKDAEKAGGKLTVTAILLKVVGVALRKFPNFNASLDMQRKEIVYKDYIHIGVAVDTERGLLVPVIRNVDQKGVIALAVELAEIAARARNKQIKPDELQGGNFSISNLGGIGGVGFTPIVYAPQVAVLGVARAAAEPIYRDGEFAPRLILPLSLSYDHRLIDGAEGARFLRWICDVLENPFVMLLEGGTL